MNYHWGFWENPEKFENKCGGKDICIAIVDSGINMNHDAFQGEKKKHQKEKIHPFPASKNFCGKNERDLKDTDGHGTYCAGIAAGRQIKDKNFSGVAYNARLLICNVGNNPTMKRVIEALEHIRQLKKGTRVDIVSMSFGFVKDTPEFKKCIDNLTAEGIICVAAAGNYGNSPHPVLYPAKYNDVISVGAHDEYWKLAVFSPNVPGVKCTTLGVGVRVPECGNGWFRESFTAIDGTSVAAPAVAGLIACILERKPGISSEGEKRIKDIKEHLKSLIPDEERNDLREIKALCPHVMFS